MKLLEVPNMDIEKVTYKNLSGVRATLEDRLDWLEDKEPESYGQVHDDWEDKYNDLQDILDELSELDDDEHDEDEKVEDKWESVLESIKSYQLYHGGLSRLHI